MTRSAPKMASRLCRAVRSGNRVSSWEPPASGGYYEEGAGYGYDYEHHHHHEETAVAGGGAPGYDAAQPVHDLDDLGI